MIDKKAIADSFSAAAESYDEVAYFQRDVGQALLSLLDHELALLGHERFQCLLDLGSGSGHFAPQLQGKAKQVVHMDIAEGMLAYAKNNSVTRRVSAGQSSSLFICGDGEHLPLRSSSVDAIYANLSLQWCYQLESVVNGFKRVLAPGGIVAFSTLSTNTLHELRAAWQRVDDFTHVNHFLETDAWLAPIKRAKLSIIEHKTQRHVLKFDNLKQLLRELKKLGAHNMNPHRPQGLMGKKRILKLIEAYESFRVDGQLPATYEVDYWVLKNDGTSK